jgi:predicted ATPase
MRSLDRVELDLSAPSGIVRDAEHGDAVPTVLIGPNGAGKSTLVEACEVLRKAGAERSFVGRLFDAHGGPPALLRRNAKRIELAVRFTSTDGVELTYRVALRAVAMALTIESEVATVREPGKAARNLLVRSQRSYVAAQPGMEESERSVDQDDDLVLSSAAFHIPELKTIQTALGSIEVHSAADARAPWTSLGNDAGPRSTNILRPASRVEVGGRNLPNVYHALRLQKDWPQTLERIRLALGDQIEDVITPPDPSGGRIGLEARIAGLGSIPAFAMSDGHLAYLSLLGVLRLERPVPPSLVVFDEPDLHLHPSLARRLMADLETFGRKTTVLLATHSDAMLDVLAEPARSTVLCELDERHATRLVRPDPGSLERWLEDYRGLGELRAAGYEGQVFPALVGS